MSTGSWRIGRPISCSPPRRRSTSSADTSARIDMPVRSDPQPQSSRCFIHVLNSSQWMAATGKAAPGQPPTAADYTKAGLPWFEYYDDKLSVLNGTKKLSELDSVTAKGVKLGDKALPQND